jgi:hypothetical protein
LALLSRSSYLEKSTGWTDEQWVDFIQRRIYDNTNWETRDTDVIPWLVDLINEVNDRSIGEPPRNFDENMRAASVLSVILGTWFARIQRAKAYDPNRPKNLRQKALRGWRKYCIVLMDIVADESKDHRMFPQEWDAPFNPKAKSGDFV